MNIRGDVEWAPAKINLCLFVGPTRTDARHEIVSVMQSITLCDRLVLRDAGVGGDGGGRDTGVGCEGGVRDTGVGCDRVRCPGVGGPNLADAAMAAFRSASGWAGPDQVLEIEKRIPVAGGLGGGSADAAAALRLMARRAGVDDEGLLLEVAAGLGADVPSQVRPGRVLAEGAGERLRALEDGMPYGVLVLPSAGGLSTGEVYAQADRMGLGRSGAELRESLLGVERLLDGPALATVLGNDLEPAARALDPGIDEALAAAVGAGAERAFVSGSGPTVVGLFASPEAAERAARALGSGGRQPAPVAARPIVSGVRHN